MNLHDNLRNLREEMPPWIERFGDGVRFSRQEFFRSRVVYYPGSATDGHPVRLFGSTHSAHSFVYADYHMTQVDLEAELGRPGHGFRGYHTLARLQLRESDLVPRGWTPHVNCLPSQGRYRMAAVARAPFGFIEVLERDRSLDDNHGARRLAILVLGADGIAAYDALFCQQDGISPPFAVLLQDHAFGLNYDSFGGGGLLENVAKRCDVMPRWLLVAEHTPPWEGFARVRDVDGDYGGMHNNLRFLHERP